MFRKLLKYDLKAIYKPILVIAAGVIICAIITRLTELKFSDVYPYECITPVFIAILNVISQMAFYILSVSILIVAFIKIWHRLSTNFYGDESYLTHTLPVHQHTLWNSKFISSIIVILFCVLIIALGIFIVHFSPDKIDSFTYSFIPYNSDNQNLSPAFLAFLLCFATFSQFCFIAQAGLTGIILGNRSNNNRAILSAVCGIICYSLSGALALVFLVIWSLLDSEIANSLFDNTISSSLVVKVFLGSALFYCALIACTYFFNRHQLHKGVNVE